MRFPTNKLALCGVLTALAAIFSYVEAMIPFAVGVPGIKLGLANVVIVGTTLVILNKEKTKSKK